MVKVNFWHEMVKLWVRFLSVFTSCLTRRSPKSEHPTLLPRFDLVIPLVPVTPIESLRTAEEIISAETHVQIQSSGIYLISRPVFPALRLKNDTARHLDPLQSANIPDRKRKKRGRICSKGYGGVAKPIHMTKTNNSQVGVREWETLAQKISDSTKITYLHSKDPRSSVASEMNTTLPLAEANSESDIVVIAPSSSVAIVSSDSVRERYPDKDPEPLIPLLFSRNSFVSSPLSAVSGDLWDAVPAVVLRSIPVPPPTEIVDSPAATETMLPYLQDSDGVDSPEYDGKATRFSGGFFCPQPSPPSSGSSPAMFEFPSPTLAMERFGPYSTVYSGSTTLLHGSPVSPLESPLSTPVVGKNMLLFNSTTRPNLSKVEDEGTSTFECTENFLQSFMSYQ